MNRLKELRTSKSMLQAEVAKKLNISQQAYANYESGKRKPEPETLIKLSEIFDVSIEYILGADQNKKTGPQGERSLSAEQQKIISIAADMETEDIQKLIEYVEFLKSKRNQ